MFDNILVPVDFAPKNRGALAVARQLAGDGRITLLHVIERIDGDLKEDGRAGPGVHEAPHDPPGETDVDLDRFYERLEERARERMETMAAELGESRVSTRIVYGQRAHTIVECAGELGCDLIVMSSHRVQSERPAADWISISHKVAILASCPILLVK